MGFEKSAVRQAAGRGGDEKKEKKTDFQSRMNSRKKALFFGCTGQFYGKRVGWGGGKSTICAWRKETVDADIQIPPTPSAPLPRCMARGYVIVCAVQLRCPDHSHHTRERSHTRVCFTLPEPTTTHTHKKKNRFQGFGYRKRNEMGGGGKN